MVASLLTGAALFLGSLRVHLRTLSLSRRLMASNPKWGFVEACVLLFVSHFLVALTFAMAFWAGQELGFGGFKDVAVVSFMDIFYFSLVNITTLGLGDIMPTGHLRSLAGVEALTGFILISCTAQLIHEAGTSKRLSSSFEEKNSE